MQEEVNEKTIALIVRTARVTEEVLRRSLAALIRRSEQHRQNVRMQEAYASGRSGSAYQGKQSLSSMMRDGSQLSNIEITDQNIKSFERVARKYSIDYSLKKDSASEPPRYLVFFRAKDVDVMTAAFKEYTGVSMKRDHRRESVRAGLEKAVQRTVGHRERARAQQKDLGQER